VRVTDVDCSSNQVLVRDGKGEKDRVTMLPLSVNAPLQRHMQDVKQLHARDLKEGFGAVLLAIRLPRAKRSIDPRSGIERRHHVGRLVRQRAVKEAMRQAGLATVASGHRVRHGLATRMSPRPCSTRMD
jgi:site-specific recombinase XerD